MIGMAEAMAEFDGGEWLGMRWIDRVYGEVAIDDPGILSLISTSTFQRLRGIRQAGPSALAFPFKDVSRSEHSIGVYLLLKRFEAPWLECVAGLLHDISHTAFSHAVDFIVTSAEQDHHEELKPLFLNRPDLKVALAALGLEPAQFYDDSVYPLLERPLPDLCADRLDYFFRDSLACGVSTPSEVRGMLEDLTIEDRSILFRSEAAARKAVELFEVMNREWWAGPIEAYIYNEFAVALNLAFEAGILNRDDLLNDDETVLQLLAQAKDPRIDRIFGDIRRIDPEVIRAYRRKVEPKHRRIDPLVRTSEGPRRLSTFSSAT